MKKLIVLRISAVLLLCITLAFFTIGASAYEALSMERIAPEKYMVYPYRSITNIGDPFVMYDDASEKYYMYVTGGTYFRCYSSDTMKTWTSEGDSYVVTDKSFGVKSYWAPEVYKIDNAYYMIYSAMNESGRHSIGLAKASTPKGPFTDVYDHPLFAPDYSVIDASLFFDDDGKVYLFYSKDCSENVVTGMKTSQSFGIELKKDLSGTVGTPVLVSTPMFGWESKSGSTRWNEGPFVFKQNGIYYLLFSVNFYATEHYAVGYATAKSPLGPYEKAKSNPILVGDGINTAGTGHCALTRSPDGSEIYIAYHSHNNPLSLEKVNRVPCIDKLVVCEDGTLKVSGHSTTIQPLPSGASGLYKKNSGISITSGFNTLLGDTEKLTDELLANVAHGNTEAYSFICSDEKFIEIKYDTPITLDSLWIYGVNSVRLTPRKVYAVINDTYKTATYTFSSVAALEPAVIGLSNLPSGVKVENVKLYFEARDSFTPVCSISEIITIYK